MIGRIAFVALFVAPFFGQACAQAKRVWVKAAGYYFIPLPGTLPVDQNGQPLDLKRDTVFLLFVETRRSGVKWEKVWRNGKSFPVGATATTGRTAVGRRTDGNRNVEWTPAKGHTLWRLEPAKDGQAAKAPQPLKRGAVLLKGSCGKKTFYLTVSPFMQLASPEYP